MQMQLTKENEVMEQFDMKKWSDKHLEEGPISWLKNKFKGKGKDNEEQITYTDKDGEKGEMSATGAKRLPDDHPAKIAWQKTQDKSGDEQGAEKVKGADMFAQDDGEKSEEEEYQDKQAQMKQNRLDHEEMEDGDDEFDEDQFEWDQENLSDEEMMKKYPSDDVDESKTSMVDGRFDINEWKNNTSKHLIKRTK
tara:strand:- start:167 stop:748 length:582 start_codon:yes stop_codon:yes gene_type:complete